MIAWHPNPRVMDLSVEKAALLLLIAAVVTILSRRLRMPYSVGLVAAGIVIALVPSAPQVNLTRNLLFTILLPPLIFEAALSLDWKKLRKDLAVVLVLATVGVLLSATVTTIGMHLLVQWPWITAMLFGALISATDPVSVIALFRGENVRGRLQLLIESESLFNDGTAAVLFAILVAASAGQSFTPWQITGRIAITIGGSLVCGGVVALVALLLAGRTNDHLVELTFTTVAAYGSFLLAEDLHLSGVLATLVAGLMLGNMRTRGAISERGREALEAFWEYAAFIANSFVFLLIGMREGHENFRGSWGPIAIGILVVVLARALAVYPCCSLFARSSLRVTVRHQHVLFWGGLRGALALALALALPFDLPHRDSVISISFAVVAFSIFVQGLTLKPLLRKFDELPDHGMETSHEGEGVR
ncbi:MAG TPA: sodium:proton antiporter [Candidatus Sulfotelmatobacter sp.]|nr:sodium:proton antiporter [Candidatus Sulfotelmatobacter sp.]